MKNLQKRLFKRPDLCYSVKEANRVFNGHISRTASAGANGRNIPANDSFHIKWRYIAKEKLSANMYGNSKVCFIGILCISLLDDYG